MLSLKNLSLRRGSKLLFQEVTIQAHAGQCLGLVGPNGCGKSSLFALLQGELEEDSGSAELSPGLQIAHVEQQSPSGSLSALDYVLDGDAELRETQRALNTAERSGNDAQVHLLFEQLESIDGFSAESRAARLLHGLGFGVRDEGQPVNSFSGGWRMRLNLARALMCRSDILLLDEPTNHLDLPAILWLERWLKRYQGLALVVSHDRDFLDAVCSAIGHFDQLSIHLYNGNYSDFEAHRAARLAQQQAMYKRQQKEIRHLQSYVDRFRYKASKARQAQSRLKMIERMTEIAPAHVDSPFRFSFLDPGRQPQHLARLEDVAAGYDKPVLSGVKLLISAGDRIGLLGINGAGKSTLVKALADGRTMLSGERDIGQNTKIGYFAQHQLDQLDPDSSAADHLRSMSPGIAEAELRRYLGGFGFSGERIFEPVAPFSGGEKARLVLALIIRESPNLLLLDEPTNHLDLEMRQALGRALMEYTGGIVVISHDRHLLRSVCDDLWVVHNGKVERFERDVDGYAAWLKEQRGEESPETGPDIGTRTTAGNRRQKRREEAARRQRLGPMTRAVREAEKQLEDLRDQLHALEKELSDPALYSAESNAEKLTGLLQEQAGVRSMVQTVEARWIEASEALEQATHEIDS